MAGIEDLNGQWDVASKRPIAAGMSFEGDFLVLGAGTRLAKVGAALDEPRLLALLAAAYGRLIGSASLRHIQRALGKKRDGDLVLALMHLALSGLTKLNNPEEDARRLFLADSLISDGVHFSVIVKGLGLKPELSDESLDKYSPDQPRVPAGNHDGGQWTRGARNGSAGAFGSSTDSSADRTAARAARDGVPGSGRGGGNGSKGSAANGQSVDRLPIVEATYQGHFHDKVRDEFAEALTKGGDIVLKEVTITLPGDQPLSAKIDILARTSVGYVFGIEVKTGDDPTFTDAQQIVYPHVEAGGIVISADTRRVQFTRVGAMMFTPGFLGHTLTSLCCTLEVRAFQWKCGQFSNLCVSSPASRTLEEFSTSERANG